MTVDLLRRLFRRALTERCNACIGLGAPQLCELPKGHRGRHLKSGDAGVPGRPIPYRLAWSGDWYGIDAGGKGDD